MAKEIIFEAKHMRKEFGPTIALKDVDFELLPGFGDRLKKVIVSGKRAADLAVRLKYAGLAAEKVEAEPSYDALADRLGKAQVPVYVMPTYTALLDFRPQLIKRCGGADFWEG